MLLFLQHRATQSHQFRLYNRVGNNCQSVISFKPSDVCLSHLTNYISRIGNWFTWSIIRPPQCVRLLVDRKKITLECLYHDKVLLLKKLKHFQPIGLDAKMTYFPQLVHWHQNYCISQFFFFLSPFQIKIILILYFSLFLSDVKFIN